jgi:hypothetical protein
MDPAETLRQALRAKHRAWSAYELARRSELPPGESTEQWSEHVKELRASAEAADAEMLRLRPPTEARTQEGQEGYVPPLGPELSN